MGGGQFHPISPIPVRGVVYDIATKVNAIAPGNASILNWCHKGVRLADQSRSGS
jgi:hypothetical protein